MNKRAKQAQLLALKAKLESLKKLQKIKTKQLESF